VLVAPTYVYFHGTHAGKNVPVSLKTLDGELCLNFFGRFPSGLGVAVILIGILFCGVNGHRLVRRGVAGHCWFYASDVRAKKYSPSFASGNCCFVGEPWGFDSGLAFMVIIHADNCLLSVGNLFYGGRSFRGYYSAPCTSSMSILSAII